MSKSTRKSKKAATVKRASGPEWRDNENYIFFVGKPSPASLDEEGAGGEIHALSIGGLFAKPKEIVKADLDRAMGQLNFLIEGMAQTNKDYYVDEVTFELGFSATGKIAFITEAGVTATISVTFKSRQAAAQG